MVIVVVSVIDLVKIVQWNVSKGLNQLLRRSDYPSEFIEAIFAKRVP